METFNCWVGLDDGAMIKIKGVSYDGKLWLVPQWLTHKTEPHAIPARIIRFDHLHYEKEEEGLGYRNILLPINESALLGALPAGIEYVDRPQNIRVDIQEVRGN